MNLHKSINKFRALHLPLLLLPFFMAAPNLAMGFVSQTAQGFSTHPTRVNLTNTWNNRQSRTQTAASIGCEYKDLLTNLHDRVGVLATLDEDLRNRLQSIDQKMIQFEAGNLARLDSLAVQQTDFLKRLDSVEHIERLTKREVEELKGDEMKKSEQIKQKKQTIAITDKALLRGTRQADSVLPEMISDSLKLDSLATLLASTRSAIFDLQTQFQSNITRLTSIVQKRLNNIQRQNQRQQQQQQHQQGSFYSTSVQPQTSLVSSCAQGAPTANNILQVQLTPTSQPFYVLCDEVVSGGGWTVIQHRFNGELNFGRNWHEYKTGFGNLAGEFFIGLEKLHALTSSAVHELLIQMFDWEDETRWAKYDLFAIGSEQETYPLNLLGKYEGDAGDSLTYHAGSKFSTFDSDNDGCPECNCAQSRNGGWWYNWCDTSNLNGKYHTANQKFNATELYQGMYWRDFHGPTYSLKAVRMLIRPVSASEQEGRK